MNRRQFMASTLFALFLLAVVFVPISSQQTGAYNPWLDVNDDGSIDITDLYKLARAYSTSGTPLNMPASIEYDSGWVDIQGKQGQNITLTHNLNNTDVMVDIVGKTAIDGGEHKMYLGLTGTTPGWNKTYGGASIEVASSIVQTSDSGFVIAAGTFSFGAGSCDLWLIKTDYLGSEVWNKTYGGTGSDSPNSVIQTNDGGYAFAGTSTSYGAGDYDIWILKTDEFGNMQWNKTFGGSSRDIGQSVIETNDGGFALVGYTWSFAAGWSDAWLIKTDGLGNMEWNKTFTENNYNQAFSIVQTSDGGYVLTGTARSSEDLHDGDMWIIKTDPAGNLQWDKTYGGEGTDTAHSFVQTLDGGYAFSGCTNSTGAGDYDFWLVKTDANGDMEWNRTYGGAGMDWARSLLRTADGGYAMAGHTNSFGVGNRDYWLVKTDDLGNKEWDRTFGGTADDQEFSLTQTDDGGYVLAGHTYSFGAGERDAWLVKLAPELGLAQVDSTPNTITLYRGITDPYWNYVRVRIWVIKETP